MALAVTGWGTLSIKTGMLPDLIAGKKPECLTTATPQPEPVEVQPEPATRTTPTEAPTTEKASCAPACDFEEETPGNAVEVRAMVQFNLPAIFTDARIPLTVITDQHGDPWWVAREVCQVLGLTHVTNALSSLDDDEKSTCSRSTCGLKPGADLPIINEPGLYALIGKSRKPEAKAFKRWVNHEVLPEIRKTGSYSAQPAMTDGEKLRALAQGVLELTDWQRQAQPKVAYYDTYATCEGLLTLTEAAKHLGLNPNQFIAQLRYDKVLYKTGTTNTNKAFQQYIDNGCFVLNAPTTNRGYAWPQTLVTPKGLLFLIARYGRFGNRAAVMHPGKTPTMSPTPSA